MRDNMCMTNQHTPHLTWSRDDYADPYPAALQTINEVFLKLSSIEGSEDPEVGIIGGSEPDILNLLYLRIKDTIDREDPHSIGFFTADLLEEA